MASSMSGSNVWGCLRWAPMGVLLFKDGPMSPSVAQAIGGSHPRSPMVTHLYRQSRGDGVVAFPIGENIFILGVVSDTLRVPIAKTFHFCSNGQTRDGGSRALMVPISS